MFYGVKIGANYMKIGADDIKRISDLTIIVILKF